MTASRFFLWMMAVAVVASLLGECYRWLTRGAAGDAFPGLLAVGVMQLARVDERARQRRRCEREGHIWVV